VEVEDVLSLAAKRLIKAANSGLPKNVHCWKGGSARTRFLWRAHLMPS